MGINNRANRKKKQTRQKQTRGRQSDTVMAAAATSAMKSYVDARLAALAAERIVNPHDSSELVCYMASGADPAQTILMRLKADELVEYYLPRRALQIAGCFLKTVRELPGKKIIMVAAENIDGGNQSYDIHPDGMVGYDPGHEEMLLGHLARAAAIGGRATVRQFLITTVTVADRDGLPKELPAKNIYLYSLDLDGYDPLPPDPENRFEPGVTVTELAPFSGELLPLPSGFTPWTPVDLSQYLSKAVSTNA